MKGNVLINKISRTSSDRDAFGDVGQELSYGAGQPSVPTGLPVQQPGTTVCRHRKNMVTSLFTAMLLRGTFVFE